MNKICTGVSQMKYIMFLICTVGFIISCSSDSVETVKMDEEEIEVIENSWSVPQSEVLGPYSPFPLVTNSSFVSVDEVNYPDNHLTALISLGPDEIRAYPNAFFALYEVINNDYEDKIYALTHCPLTGSTICWDRNIDGETHTIKASGYLFKDNLMPTDIETGSIWSQMLMRGVSGKHDQKRHNIYNTIETDWKTVKTQFPEAKVYNEVVEGAQLGQDVETEPTNRNFYRYGILSGVNNITVHIYSYDLFEGMGLTLKTTLITGKKVLVVGNKASNFISSYFVDNDTEFSVDETNSFNFIDNKANTYNALGLVIEGPDKDLQLDSPKAYTATWVAWQDLFEDFTIQE
ncbi:MAG: DUF3179 domain-containing protein [Pricia sp.]|nr:DUF3179 domain-containing protein [Pricia sp.]